MGPGKPRGAPSDKKRIDGGGEGRRPDTLYTPCNPLTPPPPLLGGGKVLGLGVRSRFLLALATRCEHEC